MSDVATQVGRVCVVWERLKDGKDRPFLYGIFTDEAGARRDYGAIDDKYDVSFDNLPLWAAAPVGSPGEETPQ